MNHVQILHSIGVQFLHSRVVQELPSRPLEVKTARGPGGNSCPLA